MALPAPDSLYYPTFIDVRDQLLRSYTTSYDYRGLVANVGVGSELYIRANALARLLAVSFANNKIAHKQVNPLTAVGTALIDFAGAFGVLLRSAAPASGFITCTVSSGSVVIPPEFRIDINGELYETVTANTVSNGGAVLVTAVNGGAATNVAPGTVAQWSSGALSKLSKNAAVGAGGLTGGVDADGEEDLRLRLLERLANPLGGGNWSQVKAIAESASASVSKAFVYPAARGPSSLDVAVVRAIGDRTLSSLVTSQVAAAIVGELPGSQSVNVTSVAPEELDIGTVAVLPLAVSAGGAGGGWRDTTPWPNATTGNVKVNSYTAPTAVTSATALTTIGTRIGIWDPDAEVMREYTISSQTLGATLAIEVEGGFGADPTGAYISTGAVNLTNYATTALAAFQSLGPGQKSTDVSIVPRALRKPSPDASSPADTSSLLLANITNEHPEIQSLDWSYRYETGTTTTKTAADVPASTNLPPEQLVLKHFAIRKA